MLTPIEQAIKEKVERIGTPLKNWSISINYGIKTGYNEAFIIDGTKRTELIEADPKSAEVIRPILRGRDIKRYGFDFADLWLISLFPSLKLEIDRYPAIKRHLLSFGYDRLKQTGDKGARKKTNNQWFETQDSISYWDDFSKQKIVYPDIMRMPRQEDRLDEYPYFYFDEEKFYVEATNFIMTGRDVDLIYLFLTSDLGFFTFSKFYSGPQFDATGFRYKKAYLDEMFMPIPTREQASNLRTLMASLKKKENVSDQINDIWVNIVGLNNNEIELVKNYKASLLSFAFNESDLFI